MLRLTATIVQPSDTLKTNEYLLRLGIYIPTNVAAEVIMYYGTISSPTKKFKQYTDSWNLEAN